MQELLPYQATLGVNPPVAEVIAPAFSSEHVAALLAGADAGLALFDDELRLVFANAKYLELCGYSNEEAGPGVQLAVLAAYGAEAAKGRHGASEETVRLWEDQLKSGGTCSFRLTARSGKNIHVHRRRLDNGRVVETVREVEAGASHNTGNDRLERIAEVARTRMHHALDSMADGFALFDAEDKLLVYNRQHVDLNPHIADFISPGRSFEEMLRTGMERSGYETHGMESEKFIAWRLELHQNPGGPHDLLMNDGRWVRVHEKRTSDGGIVSISSDITEIKQRESEIYRVSNELRRRNMLFDTALNNMVQGLCMFDADQTLIVCNRRYLEMYGFSPEVVKPGIKLGQIMEYSIGLGNYTDEDAARARAERPDHAKLRKRGTLKQFLRDGRVIAVMHQPMPDGGSIATYHDISDVENSQAALRLHARKLEESNRELQDFASVASYDLQEPLRKIDAFGERLRLKLGSDLPQGADVYLDRMESATEQMRMLIGDLLSYSRLTSKAKPFERCDLNVQMAEVLCQLQADINESGATVKFQNLPVIQADPVQLRLLLQNVVSNALKFRKPGVAPIVTITSEILPPDPLKGLAERCRLTVADNGIGFDNKYKDQIFTIFRRLHGGDDYQGTGIGLAICQKIAGRHNGAIEATAAEGEGAEFVITLPVDQHGTASTGEEHAAAG